MFITYYSLPICVDRHHIHHQNNLQHYKESKQTLQMQK